MTEPPFLPVETAEALERAFAGSAVAPVVLFLHDPYCGTSARAFGEVAALPGPVYLVDVSGEPQVSRAIAARTGVRHESPQVLVLRDGAVAWHASHLAVTAVAVWAAVAMPAASADAHPRSEEYATDR